MAHKISQEQKKAFFNYIKEFYGKGGEYKEFFPRDFLFEFLSDAEILKGIEEYLTIVDEKSWGGGDSIDRENVKWIMMSNRHDKIAKQIDKLKKKLAKYPKLEEKNLENFNKLSFGI